jgi:ornithine carbamoyltransferase
MSMGDPEAERAEKFKVLTPFTITDNLMALTEKDSIFMHCLPAHRGQEVSPSVIDGPQSKIYQQAHNRMHAARGVLAFLMGAQK